MAKRPKRARRAAPRRASAAPVRVVLKLPRGVRVARSESFDRWPFASPRPNPGPVRVELEPPRWMPLRRAGKYAADVRDLVRGRSGVYAIRDPRNPRTVLYVGMSKGGHEERDDRGTGKRAPGLVGNGSDRAPFRRGERAAWGSLERDGLRMWRTIVRHSHPWSLDSEASASTDRAFSGDLDVAIYLAPPSKAWDVETAAIADLEPVYASPRGGVVFGEGETPF